MVDYTSTTFRVSTEKNLNTRLHRALSVESSRARLETPRLFGTVPGLTLKVL